jgi:hypothetical protein
MSLVKRLHTIEEIAGVVDRATGSTEEDNISMIEWRGIQKIQAAVLVKELVEEFGTKAVTHYENENGFNVSLRFASPWPRTSLCNFCVDKMLTAAYEIIVMLETLYFEEQMSAAGLSYPFHISATKDTIQILYASHILWCSQEDPCVTKDQIERSVRSNLADVIETVKTMEGVG